ncbi:MAG: energy-coupling factor ABC transporter permease [Bacillota bacterium]|nr:energy-coupling factor ABC transporter permease [Bacillota bacterium]
MHMADSLISPAVGGVMWAASAGVIAYSVKKIEKEMDEKKAPLMGVVGAFVFAAQMINFTIPGTGSSGHIGGGILLAALLGPYAGFLTLSAVLIIQALFFADGGLLSYGCNVINMGFYACFIAYPFIYKWITKKGMSTKRIFTATIASCIVGLQLGAFSVVLETLLSGKTELPFGTFVALMQPVHLIIGTIEGIITGAVVSFVWKARPEIIESSVSGKLMGKTSIKNVMIAFALLVVITGGVFSWFASKNPDGLEWSIKKITGSTEIQATDSVHKKLEDAQKKTVLLPDYGFKTSDKSEASSNAGASASGLIGGGLTLALAAGVGIVLSKSKNKKTH